LVELRLPTRDFGELVQDLRSGVVPLCTKDSGAKYGRALLDDGFDELACEVLVVRKRNGKGGRTSVGLDIN
jgi:hypothetical protein